MAALFLKQKHMKGQGLHGFSTTAKFLMEFFVVSVISDQAMAVDCYRLLFFFFFKVVLFSETEGRSISLCKRERKVTLVIITKCSGSPGVIWRKRRQGPVECRS